VSDESCFSLSGCDGCNHVWRRRGERVANACILEHDSFRGWGSLIVWAGISAQHKATLVIVHSNLNAPSYRDIFLPHHAKQAYIL
jgi:hypothetical protein